MTAQETLDLYHKRCEARHPGGRDAPDAAEAIEALHPFAVSRVARFCADERDLEYIRDSKKPVHLFGDALTAPPSRVPPREKAAIWLDYVRLAPVDDYLARLNAHFAELARGCGEMRITHERADTSRPFHETLSDILVRYRRTAGGGR